MPPRKNRPVLFEVVARTQRSRRRSGVIMRGTPAGATTAPSAVREPTVAAPVAPAGPREPAVQIADGRLRLVLGWPHAIVLGALLVAVVVAAFQAGVRSMQPAGGSNGDLEELLAAVPQTEAQPAEVRLPTPARGRGAVPVVTPLTTPSSEESSAAPTPPSQDELLAPPETPTLVAGAYYVVVQHFPRRAREAAEAARAFLRARGVECVLHGGAGDWMLIVAQPFASEREAAKLVSRVRELGKEYFPTGRYDFKEAAARKF